MADLTETELLASLRRRPDPRGFALAMVAALAAVAAAAYWAVLPAAQHLTQPPAGLGPSGAWVFLPSRVCRIVSAAMLPVWLSPLIAPVVRRGIGPVPTATATLPVRQLVIPLPRLITPLLRRFLGQSPPMPLPTPPPVVGSPPRLSVGQRANAIGLGCLLLSLLSFFALLWLFSIAGYLFDRQIIGPTGIDVPLKLRGPSHYDWAAVAELTELPPGMVAARNGNGVGPLLTITFADGWDINLGEPGCGVTDADLAAVRRFVADRTGKQWSVRPDAVRP